MNFQSNLLIVGSTEYIWRFVLPSYSKRHLNQHSRGNARAGELNVHGRVFSTIDGLSNILGGSETDIVLPQKSGMAPIKSHLQCSKHISSTLLETRQHITVGPECPPYSIALWNSTTGSDLRVLLHDYVPENMVDRLMNWVRGNCTILAFGEPKEHWDDTWTFQRTNDEWIKRRDACLRLLATTIMSRMRIAIFENGEMGWVHPESQRGDKIAKIIGCERHVVLRPSPDAYRVIGEARLHWMSTKLEVSGINDSLTLV